MCNDNSISPSAEHSRATNFSEPSGASLLSDQEMRREVAQKFREVLASFKPSGTAQDQRARVFIEAEIERLEAEVFEAFDPAIRDLIRQLEARQAGAQ
jgi:hypothetical protein